jgi:hypothetical protein
VKVEEINVGRKFIVSGEFYALDGRTAGLTSVWKIEDDLLFPKFVTAFPKRRGKK